MTFREQLIAMNACREAREWVGDRTGAEAWAECPRGDWMEWLADQAGLPAQIAPAQRAYYEARATARRAYDEARATAQRAYAEAIAPARRAYDEARATAERAYAGEIRRLLPWERVAEGLREEP